MNEDVIICVVDDDERVRIAIARLLKSEGYATRTFPSGVALLAEAWPFDGTPRVVLTDLRMPGIDGMALARRLGASPVPPPIIFLTAHGDETAAARAMQGGAVDFLEKPVQDADLFKAVARAAAQSREQIAGLRSPGKCENGTGNSDHATAEGSAYCPGDDEPRNLPR
jgi:FixJ family two-component response regulator